MGPHMRTRLISMSDERSERLARNEALFREANERMADWDEAHTADSTEPYFCECADPTCREKVSLTRGEYERIRADPRLFFIVAGHEIPDVETVVERNDGWSVIRKNPDVAHVVEDDNAAA
jgi:hypothetical protein